MTDSLQIYPNPEILAQSAANLVLQTIQSAVHTAGRCSISLSGGSTPRALYTLMAQPEFASQVDWTRVTVFWGDERCVPPDHPDSNYLMARLALLDHLPPEKSPAVFRMAGEIEPIEAARRYETVLRDYFGSQTNASFDLLLLGLGDDGHTASLFPHTPPIHETERWAVGHYVAKLSSWRLTLTPPVLNRAQMTIFLVAGQAKATTLQQVLHGPYNPDEYPSQIIRPTNQNLVWFVDSQAAAQVE